MNYKYNDKSFQATDVYKEFIKKNAGKGNLKIRAYAANEALPISNLKVIISTTIGDEKVIFFEGVTDSSGMIETISLPAPVINKNNLLVPDTITYEIEASYDDLNQVFTINMYDGICVLQNIKFTPGLVEGDINGN